MKKIYIKYKYKKDKAEFIFRTLYTVHAKDYEITGNTLLFKPFAKTDDEYFHVFKIANL